MGRIVLTVVVICTFLVTAWRTYSPYSCWLFLYVRVCLCGSVLNQFSTKQPLGIIVSSTVDNNDNNNNIITTLAFLRCREHSRSFLLSSHSKQNRKRFAKPSHIMAFLLAENTWVHSNHRKILFGEINRHLITLFVPINDIRSLNRLRLSAPVIWHWLKMLNVYVLVTDSRDMTHKSSGKKQQTLCFYPVHASARARLCVLSMCSHSNFHKSR